jgi:hypothetical protein
MNDQQEQRLRAAPIMRLAAAAFMGRLALVVLP